MSESVLSSFPANVHEVGTERVNVKGHIIDYLIQRNVQLKRNINCNLHARILVCFEKASWSIQILAFCPWPMLDLTQSFPVSHCHCQDWVVGCQACGLRPVKDGMDTAAAMKRSGSRNGKISVKTFITDCEQLLINLTCVLTTKPFLL